MAKWDLSQIEKTNRRRNMIMWILIYINCALFCILVYNIIWKGIFS